MNSKESKFFLYGILCIILLVLFGFLTVLFSDVLIKYSGITTFYSLLAIFAIFITTEYFKKREEKRDNIDLLKSIFRISLQIEKDLNYYVNNLNANTVPPTSMKEFDIEGLPLEVNSKSTNKLDEKIIFANSKIETINEWKDGYMDIILEPSGKIRDRRAERFLTVWGDNITIAIQDLRNALEEIKSEIGKWINIGI